MKRQEVTIYRCDYCKKVYFRKHACEKHEKWCYKNPINFKKCNEGCKHLYMKQNVSYLYDTGHFEIEEKVNALWCEAKECYLYPLKTERKGNMYEFGDYENNPMPKECDLFDTGAGGGIMFSDL